MVSSDNVGGNPIVNLYFDESGNTGSDLLNPDQPVFSLASTNLSAEVCRELIAPLVKPSQSEAKFAKLKGSRVGQQALLALCRSPLLEESACVFMQADKRYYLLSHLVDKVIEPVMHDFGQDLYAGDAHVGLTNVFYHAGASIFPNGHWEQIQRALLKAFRQLSREAFAEFQKTVNAALPFVSEEDSMFRMMLLTGAGRIEQSLGVFRGMTVFDPAVDVFIAVVHTWMNRHPGPLAITHDQSKPLKHSGELLRSMMSKIPSRIVGYGERKVELPLRISSLQFSDSQSLPQLQLADILAGLTNDCLLAWSGKRPENDFHLAMKETPIANWSVRGLLPDLNIVRRNDPAPGEVSLVDGSAAFMREVSHQVPDSE